MITGGTGAVATWDCNGRPEIGVRTCAGRLVHMQLDFKFDIPAASRLSLLREVSNENACWTQRQGEGGGHS